MNKALEIIEARWLFDLRPEQIEVILHPESVIHSFVEFTDGSIVAQLSPPDMRLPIQYALTYPERVPGPARRLCWSELSQWTFEQPDQETFPALALGYEVARRGGTLSLRHPEGCPLEVPLDKATPGSRLTVKLRGWFHTSGDQPQETVAKHRELARLSSQSHHLIATKSGHWIQFDEPDLVVSAIRNVVDRSRTTNAA